MANPIQFFDSDGVEVEAQATPPELVRSEVASDSAGRPSTAQFHVARPNATAFLPRRFEIADGSDWIVEDVLVHGVSQFSRPGGVPGDVFNADSSLFQMDAIQTAMNFGMVALYAGDKSPEPGFSCKVHGIAVR